MKQIFILLLERLKSKTPKTYKYIAWGAGIIGLAALTLPALPITLPVIVTALLPTVETLCGIVVTTSLFKTSDEKLIKETGQIVDKAKTVIKNINNQRNIKK